jgi:hypothetical protein
MPLDYTLDKNKVRLLISDVGGISETDFIFTDLEIEAFLAMETGSVYRAAGVACRTIAGNEAMVSKRINFLELSTDGPAVATSLLKLAEAYDKKGEDTDEDDGAGFEIAEIGTTPYHHFYDRFL